MNRRHFFRSTTGSLLTLTPATHLLSQDTDPAPTLPTVRQITRQPGFHWFGYYDKLQFSPDDRYVLSNQVHFEHRSPKPDDVIQVGMVDLQDNDKWIELGTSHAWNWQQGCMLQWVPGTESTVMWNDRQDGQLVCHLLDIKSGKKRTLPRALYALSPDGKWGISTDFRRLNDTRPGYGYTGVPDPNKDILAPADSGLWRVTIETGEEQLIFTMAQAAAIPYTGSPDGFSKNAKHWFNHLLFSPDGSRFIFLHRWRGEGDKGFVTRLFTINADGTDPYILDPLGKTSHFVWQDSAHVFAFAFHPSHGERFYLFKDKTTEVQVIGKDKMPVNGHNTYLPNTNYEWVLNDTYPDTKRLQNPYLYHIPTDRRLPLGHFYSPAFYTGEWRCDNHPRSSRSGKLICIDSPHNSGRQLHLIDATPLLQ
ncbi:MAG: hypothetical protein QE274_17010 [Verrucomicrobiaceae bacterium]|nr:hypothetical protein [Verrucomicrobiaceae bacterium]